MKTALIIVSIALGIAVVLAGILIYALNKAVDVAANVIMRLWK